MLSTGGFGFFSDFTEIVRWAGLTWQGQYSGQYPYPLMLLLAVLVFETAQDRRTKVAPASAN